MDTAARDSPVFDFDIAIVGLGYVGLPTAWPSMQPALGCSGWTSASAGSPSSASSGPTCWPPIATRLRLRAWQTRSSP